MYQAQHVEQLGGPGNIQKPHLLLLLLARVEKGRAAPNHTYAARFLSSSLEFPSETVAPFTEYPQQSPLSE